MSERRGHEPMRAMAGHVLGKIGIHFDESCAPGLHLHLAPAVVEPDGQVAFGVLGTFLDLASGQAEGIWMGRPFVHGDLGFHRLAPPRGTVLSASARMARLGGRTAVVEVDLVDDAGTRVAFGSQGLVFLGPAPAGPAPRGSEFRRAFLARFDGRCRLDRPLLDLLGIERVDRPGEAAAGDGQAGARWRMPINDHSRNGFGGLHGGVATTLVDVAAAGMVEALEGRPARTASASVRYLTPAEVGPFRADPELLGSDGAGTLVRVPVVDEGAGGRLVILAEARVA